MIMLEDFRLNVFMAVAQEKSFTKAASVLGITQPAVSQNVGSLEKELEVKLFERLKGDVLLTAEGRVFMRYAEKMLKLCKDTESLFAAFPESVVKVSSSEELYAYHISPRLSEFAELHPQVHFERAIFDDADISFLLCPSGTSSDDAEVLAKLRVSLSAPETEMGDLSVTHEETLCFDIVCQTTAAFSCTRLCRLLKAFLTLNS